MRGLVLVVSIVLAAPAASGQPTREDIVAHLAECVARDRAANLVEALGTDFHGLDLRDIDFKGVHRAYLETDLSHADLSGCDLRGADFGGSILRRADLRNSDLRGASFVTADFTGADLRGARLEGSRIRECDFSAAILTGLDFRRVELGESNFFFLHADLEGANLSGLHLYSAHFDRARLVRADLSGARLGGATFREADLAGANLSRCELEGADFGEANLAATDLSGTQVRHADFRRARGLSDADRERLVRASEIESREREIASDLRSERIVDGAMVAIYALTFVLTVAMWRRGDWRTDWALRWALWANLALLSPPLVVLAFLLAGGHPTVQMNRDQSLWSAWSTVMCVQVLSVPLATVVLCGSSVASLVNRPLSGRRFGVLSAAFCLSSLGNAWVALAVLLEYLPRV